MTTDRRHDTVTSLRHSHADTPEVTSFHTVVLRTSKQFSSSSRAALVTAWRWGKRSEQSTMYHVTVAVTLSSTKQDTSQQQQQQPTMMMMMMMKNEQQLWWSVSCSARCQLSITDNTPLTMQSTTINAHEHIHGAASSGNCNFHFDDILFWSPAVALARSVDQSNLHMWSGSRNTFL